MLLSGADRLGRGNHEKAGALFIMHRFISAGNLPPHEMLSAFRSIEHEVEYAQERAWVPTLSYALTSGFRWAGEEYVGELVPLRQMVTALAVERYRLIGGQCPATLDALVPALLPAIPLDPYDGKAMRYRREDADTSFTAWAVIVKTTKAQ